MGNHQRCRAGLLALLALTAPVIGLASIPDPESSIVSPTRGPQLVAKLSTRHDPAQQYSLLLPDGYSTGKKWPVLIILDPRGRAEAAVEMARPGAVANGWIVLSSYQSRSDDLESITLTALQALLREVGQQYAYDPRRVYLAGMSGTAKSLWTAQEALHGLVAGFIGCGGGRPPELGKLKTMPPAFYGIAGLEDFNNQEMHELDAMLAQAGSPRSLVLFEGGHGWPPNPSYFTAAIDWLELMAMREGLAPKREAWIESQFLNARSLAGQSTTALEHWRRLDQLIRDFDGLRDLSSERVESARWLANPETKQSMVTERRLRGEEQRFARQFNAWVTRFNQRTVDGRRQSPPDLSRTRAELRIRSLQSQSADSDPLVAASATRRLELVYVAAAHYLPDAQWRVGDLARARMALGLALTVFPERAYGHCRLAQVEARDSRLEQAFNELKTCLDRGYRDKPELLQDPDWQPMREDPRWEALLATIKLD